MKRLSNPLGCEAGGEIPVAVKLNVMMQSG